VPRPRELDIPLGFFSPGNSNSITDVHAVRVGHATVRDEVAHDGRSEIHTGVTCIWPHDGWPWEQGVYAAAHVLNGHGELIGITEIQECGLLRSPILLTSSLHIGAVYDATVQWASAIDERQARSNFFMPVVTEVSDVILSDNRRFPITAAHVREALTGSSARPPTEGAVGAGAGTICYGLKGGIGSASRVVLGADKDWTIGVLVLTNYGARRNLTIAGVRVGSELDVPSEPESIDGSCIVILATDAPLLPHQLRRLALRGSIGLTRSGGFAGHTSGEITLAFSTAARVGQEGDSVITVQVVRDGSNEATFNRLFEATVEAVNEAVLNSLFAATTATGLKGRIVHALPIDETMAILARHGAIRHR
jgi:D-aminopeptidase